MRRRAERRIRRLEPALDLVDGVGGGALDVGEALVDRVGRVVVPLVERVEGVARSVDRGHACVQYGTAGGRCPILDSAPDVGRHVHDVRWDAPERFIRDIADNPDDGAIVSSIVSMAHNLWLKTIAEGVETEEQLKILRILRCDMVQGYFFSKPVPADVVEGMLANGR